MKTRAPRSTAAGSPAARSLRDLARGRRGLSTVEYIIILCLIAVVCFAMWKQFGQTVEYKTKGASNQIGELPTDSTP